MATASRCPASRRSPSSRAPTSRACSRARLAGRPAPPPFRYRDYGTLATIGRRAAVADFGWIKLHGTVAWLLWGLVHISFLIGFSNRLVVMLDWIWSYVTFQSGARLITGLPDSR